VELDQVAFPVLLAWRLGVADALEGDPYPGLVRRAAVYLLRQGPRTDLDRWEDAGGFSPSTLAAVIAALLVAAEFGEDAGEAAAAEHLRAVADYWNEGIERWCYLRAFRHYVRITSDPDRGAERGDTAAMEFLELVRRGRRAGDAARIEHSLTTADVILRIELPGGPGWRRYAEDEYGETDDGAPWQRGLRGRGRSWPILTGERAHQALAAGRSVAGLVTALEACAGPDLLLPEQVWDAAPLPERGLDPGRATGSVAPLGWAHAEYLSLLAAIAGERLPDVVDPARRRYAGGAPAEPAFVWSHAHRFRTFQEGRGVRVQLERPALVRWTADGWATFKEVAARDTSLGFWVADLPTQIMRPGAVIEWTAHYDDGWEGVNYALECAAAPA